jgi:hypothetical protein
MTSVNILSGVKLSVIMPSVGAPFLDLFRKLVVIQQRKKIRTCV